LWQKKQLASGKLSFSGLRLLPPELNLQRVGENHNFINNAAVGGVIACLQQLSGWP
jgi:hypothetical protein